MTVLYHPGVPATKDFGQLNDRQMAILKAQGWLPYPQEEEPEVETESPEEASDG